MAAMVAGKWVSSGPTLSNTSTSSSAITSCQSVE
jgi:hypothetical protein